jgi:hypothetical protein
MQPTLADSHTPPSPVSRNLSVQTGISTSKILRADCHTSEPRQGRPEEYVGVSPQQTSVAPATPPSPVRGDLSVLSGASPREYPPGLSTFYPIMSSFYRPATPTFVAYHLQKQTTIKNTTMKQSITIQPSTETSAQTKTNARQAIIAIACLSFFPLVYLIGKAVMAG